MSFSAFANPGKFLRLAKRCTPVASVLAALFFAAGIFFAFWNSPPDYQQGETVRIMYIHVPAAWLGLSLYMTMALASASGLIWQHRLSDVFCQAAAPVGASFTALCLITGSLWGRPTWGTYWVWDARLTSVLILFLLYLGYISLRSAFDDDDKGAKASGLLLLMGAINIPIIHFSVVWWNTLHQGSSVFRTDGPSMAPSMLRPLLLMALAYVAYATLLILRRMQTLMLTRRIEAKALKDWI